MIIAYIYIDPIIDKIPSDFLWGCEINKVYQDISDRKQLKKLMKDCHVNSANYLLIRSLSEFGDTLSEINQIMAKIEDLNIEIVAIEEDYNTNKFKIIKDSKTKEKLIILWEEIRKKIYHRKLLKSHSHNRLNTLPPPGKAPFGYLKGKDSYIINRATSPIIRDFFDRFLLYSSVSDSVRYLERKYNKKIALSTAIHWLKNPIYRGDLSYKNQEIITDTHTAIISREEAAQIDRILKSHSLVKSRSASANYALAGLVRCRICQSPFRITKVTNKRYPEKYLYLIPSECQGDASCKSFKYHLFLDNVINQICKDFSLLIKQINVPSPNLTKHKIEKTILEKEAILSKIQQLRIEDILDEETTYLRSYTLNLEIATLKQQMTQLPPDNLNIIASTLSNPQFWYDLSPSECRFYLREFIKKIDVMPIDNNINNYDITLNFVFSNYDKTIETKSNKFKN
ncbi:hypothetical protein GM3708_141 [Geminocystis sp. NIES-3708]|uniref:recombinase family protein n=1 Tax=Geminocystis sp. NIES-3708 TaxID=1615909 RepID=UPI0005FCD764|nr:recombinase family protein [Geminocystis sp. NIES-3708]BAQ59736.1 hypothetical protein GM3708_141 [Geminocystis sp. NIES-3708]